MILKVKQILIMFLKNYNGRIVQIHIYCGFPARRFWVSEIGIKIQDKPNKYLTSAVRISCICVYKLNKIQMN